MTDGGGTNATEKRRKEACDVGTKSFGRLADFVWALIVLFMLIGSIALPSRREALSMAMIVCTSCWAISEILRRGIDATKAFFGQGGPSDGA